jgi:phosphoribosylanthranilate isomerase
MVKIKICGLRNEGQLALAVRAGADAVGFVLHETSPRNVMGSAREPFGAVTRLVASARALGVLPVVLLVNRDADWTLDMVRRISPGAVQLHGAETPEHVARLRAQLPRSVALWKALGIANRKDLYSAQAFADAGADALLLDARPPPGATRTGGLGHAFDWSVLAGWQAPLPWWLAGGLNADNVAQALRQTRAPGVDVSSGVETSPGRKSAARMKAFTDAARSACTAAGTGA